MKKGDLSLNLIIVAAILMVVFFVLILIFSGRMGIFTKSVDKCQGTCVKTTEECSGTYQKVVEGKCDLDGDSKFDEGMAVDGVCCIAVGG